MDQWKFFIFVLTVAFSLATAQENGDGQKKKEKPPIWEYRMFWNNDVYTGRHFDELISSYDVDQLRVNRDTVLIMYEDDSFPDLASFELNTAGLPTARWLNFVKYNYRSSPRHIFYDLVGRDNLVERYIQGGRPSSRYPYVFFFKKDEFLTDYSEFPVKDYDLYEHPEEFKKWVWNHFKTTIEFDNKLENSVLVKIQGVGPATDDVIVKAGTKVTINTHVTRLLKVFAKGQRFLYGCEVDKAMGKKPFVFTKGMVYKKNITDEAWTKNFTSQMAEQNSLVIRFGNFLAHGYLRSFKQPVLLPAYTDAGFTKRAVPGDIQSSLLMFLDSNKAKRIQGCILPDGSRSGGDVDCTSITLPLDIKMKTADLLRPMVEDWCGTRVEMTRVYGINEYWDRSVMRGLIGKVSEHVISVIMVLRKDLRGRIDWEMELVDPKGKIQYTFVNGGELLMYESSTVFMKRPKPLMGRNYVTVIVHYRPRTGWPWRMSMEDTRLTDGETEENILMFNTPETLRKEFRKTYHGEL